jgi:O-antigen/teichoic acid export membrane protein
LKTLYGFKKGNYNKLLMNTSKLTKNFGYFLGMLSSEKLTIKASLNSLAAALEFGARLMVGFIVSPFLVAGLGNFYFGAWQVLLRLTGAISPASGRASQALKWSLANEQSFTEYEIKRGYVGSALAVWAIFLPFLALLGGLLAWFVPNWIKAPEGFIWYLRLAAGLLVMRTILNSLADIPRSVLEGVNLGYRRMGLSALLVFIGGGFTFLALYLDMGIIGVATATLATSILTGLFFLHVVRRYIPWFGVRKPSCNEVRRFLTLSGWFLASKLVLQLMLASDVALLGILNSAESVSVYTLTKYAPETIVTISAIVAWGVAPGLGGIMGAGNLEKAAHVRGEIMSITWLLVTVFGSTVILWNQEFINLWVGQEYYAGSFPALLIMCVVVQFVLIRNDEYIIDLTLCLRQKVIVGALSIMLSLTIATLFVSSFELGISGLCLGLIFGRLILSLGYPVLVCRFLKVSLLSQLRNLLRPAFTTIFLFWLASKLAEFSHVSSEIGLRGWLGLSFSVWITFCFAMLLAFYVGLPGAQRRQILQRVKILVAIDSY